MAETSKALFGMEEDDFQFNAPGYYDLNDPDYDANYRNNADGFFHTPGKSNEMATIPESPPDDFQSLQDEFTPSNLKLDFDEAEKNNENIQDKENYQSVLNERFENMSLTTAGKDPNSKDEEEKKSLNVSSVGSTTSNRSLRKPMDVPSRLFQPTKSYLAKRDALLQAKEKNKAKLSNKTKRKGLTVPISPNIHVQERLSSRSRNQEKISSTTRELMAVRQEVLELKKKRQQHEYYRHHVAQANPSHFERSTKALTIPSSPHLATIERAHIHPKPEVHSDGSSTLVRAEDLMAREYAHQPLETRRTGLTVAASPVLSTSLRAKLRKPPSAEKVAKPSCELNKSQSNDASRLTVPHSPHLSTSERASHSHYPAAEINKEDEVELAKKFKARPVDRRIFQQPPPKPPVAKHRLTVAQSPQLSTASRARASAPSQPEQKPKKKVVHEDKPLSLTVAKSPNLRGVARHRQYKEQFERQIQEEQQKAADSRNFRAQPLPVSGPHRMKPVPSRPLTEVEPFAMPGDRMYEQAKKKISSLRRQEDSELKRKARVTATDMPDLSHAFVTEPSNKQLTETRSPQLASTIQAERRRQFDDEDRQRREIHEQQMEESRRRKEEEEEEELRQLRRQLTFHAQPMQVNSPFRAQPSTRELTIPESPMFPSKMLQKHRENPKVPGHRAA